MTRQTFIPPHVEDNELDSLSKKLFEANEKLSEANEKLAQSEKERSIMLANISHDLRAPISAIRGAVDLLQSNCEMSINEILSTVQLIDRRTATLENLIQDMYYLFSLETNRAQLQLEAIPAAPFFEEYYYSAIVDSRYSNKHMTLQMEPDLTYTLHIDVQKMIRVLDNLFTNAAKYSPDGADITLSVCLTDSQTGISDMNQADNQKRLCIQVIDTGIGIPAESLSHVFERTYTVSSSRTPNSPTGSGLGLCIAKTIVELHNGTITCDSTPGAGSTFTILLP